jgi:Na+/H+ antiporter NhaD/arsenite permease-like protein
MDLAWISLAALLVVIVVSCTTRLNPGVLAIVLAWVVAVYIAPHVPPPSGATLGMRELMAGFPRDLFLTLVGVTLLFTQAQVNGTLDRVTHAAVRLCRGNAGLIPIMFCLLTAGLASIGAGNIAASALIAPMAMATADRARIPAFLMAIMVAHGAIAGAVSPFAPTGVIVNGLLETRLHLTGLEWLVYLPNLAANLAVAFGGYLLFGGLKLFGRTYASPGSAALEQNGASTEGRGAALEPAHIATLAVIGVLIVSVLGLGADVGMTAFAGAALLALCGWADDAEAIRKMPWGVIVMVCGVTVLIALLEHTGGTRRLTEIIGAISTPRTLPAVAALLAGVISVYSSTSGVVLPAFLPLIPGLVAEIGSEPMPIASAMIIGGHLVDSSPLSTIGALCTASAAAEDRNKLFRQMLFWGLSMAVVAAVGCYVFV